MPIALADIRFNAVEAFKKLQVPSHPLFHEDDEIRNQARADLRRAVGNVRRRFLGASLVGELRKIARDFKTDVPTVNSLCSAR